MFSSGGKRVFSSGNEDDMGESPAREVLAAKHPDEYFASQYFYFSHNRF